MKVTYRIPTEQYAYVEVAVDYDRQPTPEEVATNYTCLSKAFKPQAGLPEKEFCKAVDRYLNKGDGELEVYQSMSPAQKEWFQITKRAFKRLNKN